MVRNFSHLREIENQLVFTLDSQVENWDPSHMQTACFGGVDEVQDMIVSRSYNAYMLFYEKRSKRSKNSDAGRVPEDILVAIKDQNKKFLREKAMFEDEYLNLAEAVATRVMQLGPEATELTKQASEVVASGFTKIVVRSVFVERCMKWESLVDSYLTRDPESLVQFIQHNYYAEAQLKQIFLHCHVPSARQAHLELAKSLIRRGRDLALFDQPLKLLVRALYRVIASGAAFSRWSNFNELFSLLCVRTGVMPPTRSDFNSLR